MNWQSISTQKSKNFVCGYCGADIVSEKGFHSSNTPARIYICHKCDRPTFFDPLDRQTPGSIFGDHVADISDDLVKELYDEARRCMSVSAFTAAVLCCRKLLMHIAVSKGADTGKNFVYYVEYLRDKNFVPPDAKDWVDHIRSKGNEANHEILLMQKEEAEELISFIGMLLKIIFEFPARVKRKKTS